MRREQLEHCIRAAGDVLGERELIIGGSQSILASFGEHDLPVAATLSMEVDILPLNDPDERKADLIDRLLGEGSQFHITHGFYVDGIGEATMILPTGWRSRLVVVRGDNTDGVAGYCLEPHDLAVAKLAAGRDKDFAFVSALCNGGILDASTIVERLRTVDRLPPATKTSLVRWVNSQSR